MTGKSRGNKFSVSPTYPSMFGRSSTGCLFFTFPAFFRRFQLVIGNSREYTNADAAAAAAAEHGMLLVGDFLY